MKLREAVEKLASERDIRTENESVLAKCIEDAGNKVPDLKQVEKPFVVSSLELFSSNNINNNDGSDTTTNSCLLYTSPSPRDKRQSRMPSSA